MGDKLEKVKWRYADDSTITDHVKEQIRAVDPHPDGILSGVEIEGILSPLKEKWEKLNDRIDFKNYKALDTIFKRFHDKFPSEYFDVWRCINRPRENPKEVDFIKCTRGEEWLSVKSEQLVDVPALTRRVSVAIQYIEEHGYGKVDTYGIGKRCDTFHFHLVLNCCENLRLYHSTLADIKKDNTDGPVGMYKRLLPFALKLLGSTPSDIAIVYHTDEYTTRFATYSMNRNLVDHGNGNIEHLEGPSKQCLALSPSSVGTELVQLHFAIISKGNNLYERGHPLPDGRRFIIWQDSDELRPKPRSDRK